MSTVGTIAKIATDVVGKAAHAATHPVQTVTGVASRARELATAVTGGGGTPMTTEPADFPEAPPLRSVRPQEPSTTEPKAPSRAAAHSGRGEDIDDWQEEVEDDTEVTTPAGTTGAGPGYNPDTAETGLEQPDTEPLMDPSLTKAVKAEAETMRKASDPNSGG